MIVFSGGDGVPPYNSVIVGHNVAFDFLHALRRSDEFGTWAQDALFEPSVMLWDTMIVDYLYHGCRYRSPSLEETCQRWDVPFTKDPLIQEYFESGRGADILIADGHEQRLHAYHAEDLRATREVAIRQMAALEGARMLAVVRLQLEALKLVILEQFCGLPIDLITLGAETTAAQGRLALLESQLREMVGLGSVFNPASNDHVAAVLYGGAIKEDRRVPNGVFKSGTRKGQPRDKIEHLSYPLPRRVEGAGSVDENALTRITLNGNEWVRTFCKMVLEYRETAKLVGTYLEPIAAHVAVSFDGRLHGDINMAITNTGRKSSSNPNLQNIPPVVRKVVVAPPGRKIVTADFKQLEVVAWAYLSRDKALYQDLLAGKDIHGRTQEFIATKTGAPPARTDVKRVNFGRIYGGGVRTLSAQSGVPEGIVSSIVKALDSLYPDGYKFGDKVSERLRADSVPFNDEESGLPHREAYYELPTGRRLWFRTYEQKPAPWKADWQPAAFSYTQCKNRPVQSFATADIVPLGEALVMRELQRRGPSVLNWLRPLLSVHDELVFECVESHIEQLRNLLDLIVSNIVRELNSRFALDPPFDLPLKLEIGVGDNWLEAKA